MMNERKAILYGLRMREMPEEANEKEIRRELRSLLPELFGGMCLTSLVPTLSDKCRILGEAPAGEPLTTTFWQSCNNLLLAPRFEQVKIIKQWFLPIYKRWLSR